MTKKWYVLTVDYRGMPEEQTPKSEATEWRAREVADALAKRGNKVIVTVSVAGYYPASRTETAEG